MESDRSHIRVGFVFIGVCIAIGIGLFLLTRPSLGEAEMRNLGEAENFAESEATSADPQTSSDNELAGAPTSDRADAVTVTSLRSASLVGTWGPASLNPSANPNASCDTDSVVTFNRDGSFEDGGGYGRFRVDGDQIVYFNRVIIDEVEGTEDRSEFDTPLRTHAELPDANTLNEDGTLLHRCVTG